MPSILIVDDDPIIIRLLCHMLAELAQVQFAKHGETALALMRAAPPDLVLLDVEMPGMSGPDVCRLMKDDVALADVPVIFVTSRSDPAFEASCFTLGAVDYVQKPVQEQVLLARVTTHVRLKRFSEEQHHLATVDALTDVPNRRAFDQTLQQEWARALRSGQPLSLLMVDVDYFKAFNDHYGHPAGDACLRAFADTLRHCAGRATDLIARYGGEEFAVLLPDTDADGARLIADKLLSLLQTAAIPHAHSPVADHVTASIGVSTLPPRPVIRGRSERPPAVMIDAAILVSSADRALYDAKRGGRCQAHSGALVGNDEDAAQSS